MIIPTVTPLYAGLLALFLVYLSFQVIFRRRDAKVSLGANAQSPSSPEDTSTGLECSEKLRGAKSLFTGESLQVRKILLGAKSLFTTEKLAGRKIAKVFRFSTGAKSLFTGTCSEKLRGSGLECAAWHLAAQYHEGFRDSTPLS